MTNYGTETLYELLKAAQQARAKWLGISESWRIKTNILFEVNHNILDFDQNIDFW